MTETREYLDWGPWPSGTAVTDEPDHRHYCEDCGAVWMHADESCVGPRWMGRMVMGGSWNCPSCEPL